MHRAASLAASLAASAGTTADVRLRDGIRDCVWAFLGARAMLFVLSAVADVGLLPRPGDQPTTDSGWIVSSLRPGWHVLFTATERQDALWFLRLATEGWSPNDGSAAFFPLYPLSVRALAWLPGLGPLAAALIVANAAFFAALLVLHGLTRLEVARPPVHIRSLANEATVADTTPARAAAAATARRTVRFAAMFPTSFFFLAPYTEALFLSLSLAAFWFARRDRWAAAALAGALAALTRSVGVLLIFGLAVEAFLQWRRDGRALLPRVGASILVAFGPLTYLLFWHLRFHDLWAPLDAQRNWNRQTALPMTTLWEAVRFAWLYRTYWLIDLAVVAAAVAGVGLAAVAARVRASYLTYATLSLLLPLFAPLGFRPLLSMPRFVIVVFPLYWGYAAAVDRRWLPESLITGAFAMGYGLLGILFLTWWYVF
jgi:hypothetical protein